jgi:hypothetical protein
VPAVDIAFARKPVAMFLNPSNEVEWFLLEPQNKSRFFVHQKYGIFEVDANCSSRAGKTPLYFYYSENPKPIHLKYYAMLYAWAKKNGVDKITKKDIRHSSIFDRIAAQEKTSPLEALKKQNVETNEKIQQRVDEVNNLINTENERRLQAGEPPASIDPTDYAQYILEKLVLDDLVTQEDADKLKYELIGGQVTIDYFINRLKELNVVNIVEPIPLHPRRWLEDWPTFKPADVFNYIKMSRGLGKSIEKLGLRQVHNLIPWTWVLGIVLAIIIGIAALMSSGILGGLSNIKLF